MNFFQHNKCHFTFTTDLLTVDIFSEVTPNPTGFSLMEGLLATLKIALADQSRPAIRHNLDLFNDNQMTRLITKVCERLEIGHSVVSKALNEIVERLEAERLQELEAAQASASEIDQPLSKEEEQTAIQSLKAKNLMDRTFKAFEVMGICGEAYNAMILFLAMISRMLTEPLSVICMAGSGAGKSYLVEKLSACVPANQLQEFTQLTAASLFHHQKQELAGKVLLIEDLNGSKGALFPIRELQSKKRISKTMTIKDRSGDLRAMNFVVEGPICVIACTSFDRVFIDNANRCLLLTLDNSPEQDRRIMEYQKKLRAGLIDTAKARITQLKMMNMQRVLKPAYPIINPYAPLIELHTDTQYPRHTLPLLLNFIDAITFYHQHQRTTVDIQTGEEYLETHPDDIRWAFQLLKKVLLVKSDELSTAARSFYQKLLNLINTKPDSFSGGFYANTIRDYIRLHPRTLSRYLKELTEYGYLKITGGNRHTTGYCYLPIDHKDPNLPDSITRHLEAVLKKVDKEYQKRTKTNQVTSSTSKPSVAQPSAAQSNATRPNATRSLQTGSDTSKPPKQ